MTNAEKDTRVLIGHWYDNEADARAWCDRQKKDTIVVRAVHPNGTVWYMAMMKAIADAANMDIKFAVYRKLIHESKDL